MAPAPAGWRPIRNRPPKPCENSWTVERLILDPQFLGQSQFRFIHDFFQTGEAGEGEAVDRKGANLTNGRVWFKRRPTTFLMNQREHVGLQAIGSRRSRRNCSMCSGP